MAAILKIVFFAVTWQPMSDFSEILRGEAHTFSQNFCSRTEIHIPQNIFYDVITSDKGGGICFCPCLSVCLSVSKITQKRVDGFG